MPKFLLRNHAGHEFVQEGRTLMQAKMRLCRQLGHDWNDLECGVTTIKLVEKLPAEETDHACI